MGVSAPQREKVAFPPVADPPAAGSAPATIDLGRAAALGKLEFRTITI
jgi:hypothetical protein